MSSDLAGYRRGFTLIELLVVIAIIAIIAAILFPVFAQAREKARQTVCISNTRQIATAVRMYVQDADETFPIFYAYNSSPAAGMNGHKGVEMELQPYSKNFDLFRCPDDSGAPFVANTPSAGGGCQDLPSKADSYYHCYGSSYRFTSGTYSIVAGESSQNNDTTQYTQSKVVTDAQFVYPADTRIMRDEMLPWFDCSQDPGGAKYGYCGGYYQQWHAQGGGFVFADGHAKFLVSAGQFNQTYCTPDGKSYNNAGMSNGYYGGCD